MGNKTDIAPEKRHTTGADPEGGAGAHAHSFLPQFFLKVPLIGQKRLGSEPPKPLRHLLFQFLDPPMHQKHISTLFGSKVKAHYVAVAAI